MTMPTVGGLFNMPGFGDLRWCLLARQVPDNRLSHLVVFNDDMAQVAILRWEAPDRPDDRNPDDPQAWGEIIHIEVIPSWRRQGLATAMRNLAVELADELGWLPPGHSSTRTPDGEAWATAIGGPMPSLEESEPHEVLSHPADAGVDD